MAVIGAWMDDDAVGNGIQGGLGGADHIGRIAAAGVAQHRDLVDVDTEDGHRRSLARAYSSGDSKRAAASGRRTDHNGCGRSARTRGALARSVSNSRSEEHTSELQSLMRISYAVFCLKKKKTENRVT